MNADDVERYEIARKNLLPWQISQLITKINDSDRFELGDLTFIVIKSTTIPIGYVGQEDAQLCYPKKVLKNIDDYPIGLRQLYNSV